LSSSPPELEWLDAALHAVVEVAREQSPASSADAELAIEVLRCVLRDPGAGAGVIARKLRRRRSDVLRHVKRLRAAGVGRISTEGSVAAGTAFPAATAICPVCGVELAVEVRAR
jgi:hypothetical protein